MPLIVPDASEEAMLDLILAVNYTLKLYKSDVTTGLTAAQLEALTASDFTEATFTGYSSKALTGGSWTTTQADPSTGTYAQQTFTSTADQTAQTIYGYYVVKTTGGELAWFEDFTGPLSISLNGDTIQITPTFTLDDDQEATVAARGVQALQALTANSSGYTADATTDFALNNFVADATRIYKICLHSSMNVSAAPGRWFVQVRVDTVKTFNPCDLDFLTGATGGVVDSQHIWQPASGTYNLDVTVEEFSGSSTLTFAAGAAYPRQFWVEDVGPR